jgi:hypothetical protein
METKLEEDVEEEEIGAGIEEGLELEEVVLD